MSGSGRRSVTAGGSVGLMTDTMKRDVLGPLVARVRPFPYRALDDSDWVIFGNTLPLRGIVPGHYRVGYALGEDPRAEVQWSDVWLDVR